MRWTKCCATIARLASLRTYLLLSLALLISPAFSQETTLRSQANVVLVPALVKDSSGQAVYGLQAQDFSIEDDGVEQTVRLDEAPERQPVSLVVAIQRGRRASYEFPRMQGLHSMLGPLFESGSARVALVEFDSKVELTRDFTGDENAVDADLANLQPGDNGAAILDALNYSVGLLRNEPDTRLRVLLLISETRDHGSIMKVDGAVAGVGRANVLIYSLAFSPSLSNVLDTERGSNKAEMHNGIDFLDLAYRAGQAMRKNVPSTIAQMTGGEYQLYASRKKFELRMTDFTNHLHSRYLLSFTPANPHPGLHQVRVRLRHGNDATVLARTSYWAEGNAQK